MSPQLMWSMEINSSNIISISLGVLLKAGMWLQFSMLLFIFLLESSQ